MRANQHAVIADFDPYLNVARWAQDPLDRLIGGLASAHRDLLVAVGTLADCDLHTEAIWDEAMADAEPLS